MSKKFSLVGIPPPPSAVIPIPFVPLGHFPLIRGDVEHSETEGIGKWPKARQMRGTVLVMRADRFNRRGAQCAPAGRPVSGPYEIGRRFPELRRGGCPHPPAVFGDGSQREAQGPPLPNPGRFS